MEKQLLEAYTTNIPRHLDYPDYIVPYMLKNSAEKYPEKTATTFFGQNESYKKLWERVEKLAAGLQKEGLRKGDRVLLLLPNSPVYIESYNAVMLAGGIAVQLNPLYTENELTDLAADSLAKFAITLDVLQNKLQKSLEKGYINKLIVEKLSNILPFPLNMAASIKDLFRKNLNKEFIRYDTLFSSRSFNPVSMSCDDVALFQYTGGTTGLPKAAMLTHKNIISNTFMIKAWAYKLKEADDTIMCVLPFFHVYGMTAGLNLGIVTAARLILLPQWNLKNVIKLIEKYDVTLLPGVPTIYTAINEYALKHNTDLSSIKLCISGGAPLPVEVATEFERITGGKLVEGYGLSEASPVTHCNPIWGERKFGSIGVVFPDTYAKIVDDDGNEVDQGKPGELIVKGPQVMKGYWNRPEETKKALKDGWLYTGDIALIRKDGYFEIVDRKKDLIISGGFNIYPREVEEVLYKYPAIKEAAVIGVPHKYKGEAVKAFVVLKEGESANGDDIKKFCEKNLAHYKIPKYIEFANELPKSTVGKILRRALRTKAKKATQ